MNYFTHKVICNVMHCAIWYHLYNLKNVKNTHGGVLLFVTFQAFTESNIPPWVVFTFFKWCKWYQIAQSASYELCNLSILTHFRPMSLQIKATCYCILWHKLHNGS